MKTSAIVTRVIFFLAFSSLLATTIPHVAWLYHAYEPTSFIWWVISYGIAVGIDAMACWLMWTYAIVGKGGKGVVWVFIALLVMLSWYANWLHSEAFNPAYTVNIWTIDLGFGITTGFLTPVIVSAIPLFIIVYTFIYGKVANVKTETLEEKATRLEDEKVAKNRIRAATKGRLISRIGETLTQVIVEGKGVVKTLSPGNEDEPITQASQEVKAGDSEPQNEGIEQSINGVKIDDTPGQTSPYITLTPDVLEVLNAYPGLASLLSTGQKTATINEIAGALNMSTKLVTNRVKSGVLKRSPRNEKLVTITSVITWLKMLHTQEQNASKTSPLYAVKAPHNGHVQEPITDVLEPVSTDEKVS